MLAGREAVRAALRGETARMVTLQRAEGDAYQVRVGLTDVREVMLHERKVPDAFINDRGNGVTEAFCRWCAPLIGPALPRLVSLRG